MFVLRQIDRFGSKCEKLRVSRTSPLTPYLPTCERTSTCDVMGQKPSPCQQPITRLGHRPALEERMNFRFRTREISSTEKPFAAPLTKSR